MSEYEDPTRSDPAHAVTVDDVRVLMGASTPHFALQLRARISKLIAPLPADDPARILGEREIERLRALGSSGEVRGHAGEPGLAPMPSLSPGPPV